MNLFIDTNILLNFFHFSKDNLDELEKVLVLQKYGNVNIWLTEQVKFEFARNREVKIADALKRFLDEKQNSGIPHIARGYPECEELVAALKKANSSREKLLAKVQKDIAKKTLLADTLIQNIFSMSKQVDLTEDLFIKSKRRHTLGNPPGKNYSLGDAINWETLLSVIPPKVDIYIISEDGDYSSPLAPDRLSDFLEDEWASKKDSKAILYKRVSQFLSIHFPDAKISADLEKEVLISGLANSKSFSTTHHIIDELNPFPNFTPKQASDIVDAYIVNQQIYWIASDADVNEFGNKILNAHEDNLDPQQLKAFIGILSKQLT